MSTRSRIGILNSDGSVTSIYCHSDGYLSGVGKALLDHYMNEAKVRGLMGLGDLSSLGKDIGEKHDFSAWDNDWCRSYGRDRGEKNVDCRTDVNVQELVVHSEEYTYVFNPVLSQWFYTNGNHEAPLPRLTVTVIAQE